jgi:protein tyrosine kinase modulator
MEQNFDLRRYLAVLRRRWLYLLVPAIAVFVAAGVVAYLLPSAYEATATILVESQQIPTELASPTVTTNAEERIQVIQQRLMARDNLLQIANKFDLYADERGKLSPTDKVDRMRSATSIHQIDVGSRRGAGVIGFTVTFQYTDATIASRVTNEFVSSILSQNIQTRLSRASETTKFFEQQLSKLDQQLLALEAKIAEFKRTNESALPETLPYRRTQLLQLSSDIADLDQKIQVASHSGELGSDIGTATAQQLSYKLQAKQLELESYQDQRDTLAPLADKDVIPRNRIKDLDRQIAVAELDIKAINAQIASQDNPGLVGGDAVGQLKAQRADLEKKAAALNDSILKTPQVEVELNALNRDYANLQAEYQQAQAKLADATTGERLEEDRQAERFEVLEQATVPDAPVKPNRPRIILAGSFGSLAVGAGIVILAEVLDTSIRSVADLEKRLQLRPIGVIPYVITSSERRRHRWRFGVLLVLIIAAACAALALVHFYYLPLDLIVEKLSQRFSI